MLIFILYALIGVLLALVFYRKGWVDDTNDGIHDALILAIAWVVILPCWALIEIVRANQ